MFLKNPQGRFIFVRLFVRSQLSLPNKKGTTKVVSFLFEHNRFIAILNCEPKLRCFCSVFCTIPRFACLLKMNTGLSSSIGTRLQTVIQQLPRIVPISYLLSAKFSTTKAAEYPGTTQQIVLRRKIMSIYQ